MPSGRNWVNRSLRRLRHRGWQNHLEAASPPESACPQILPLSARQVGDRVRILSLNCGESNHRLLGMGFIPGVILQIISRTGTGSAIVALYNSSGSQRLGVGAEMAQQILVVDALVPPARSHSPMDMPSPTSTLKLREAAIGAHLRVIGYEPTARDYKRKLLAMGLTPGTELRVNRHAPLGDPTEIEVRGYKLSLRKHEADALMVEIIVGGDS
ncbi:ferrous iron transport protein A [Desertifilum sp. FACHB-1129]|uniref:Ferrous iron transporter FeoA-like domain-containing protein n=2 Tax=Desertifilum tharense IPPAS B-1220 TaxID=1781255 RepID=A0A1E5QEY5_9CYAN|nr:MULTISPECIES: FeoA family protein [Desertifilum]MDA0212701.1 FeoA family protein [Cyanobacteria bacterium FC1]MBD2313068.1 ferrous iron transport protein A [Desertifilum sp. FACHB-1129]MBD2324126.1 ferrous iron transport protein A [Desertifilum sp. FACHB-866]MBD2334061.1 ferrous iron transport protein A [Desertifilum sp. FACHB-868]OEJ73144.1 hypothetical protein BH720_21600 [Desertifilum tharense IPPAS B-1220]